jgi:glycosyltransferase involved in cell wall biosynthesis
VKHFPTERRAVRDVLQSLRPDLVHSHGFRPDVLDSGIARRLGIPTVTTIHGESFMGGRTRLYEWLQWRNHRRFDAVIAVSTRLRETALSRGVRENRVHLIRNAWPVGVSFASREAARRELGLSPREVAVGWLGRMIPVKGADVFLRALAEPGGPQVTAVLIGDGSERSRLESLAAELGLGTRVRFVGAIEGGARLLPAFDAFALSSRSEGTPIVLFEAMTAGVPIVASKVGGIPDVVVRPRRPSLGRSRRWPTGYAALVLNWIHGSAPFGASRGLLRCLAERREQLLALIRPWHTGVRSGRTRRSSPGGTIQSITRHHRRPDRRVAV